MSTQTEDQSKPKRGFRVGPMHVLALFIPVAIVLELLHVFGGWEISPIIIFATSTIGVIPTAALMGRATEELAAKAGPGIGGLLNVTSATLPS